MTKIHTMLLSTTALITLLLAGCALTANALQLTGVSDATYDLEAQATTDCDDTDERCQPSARASISVTSERDAATTPATPSTDICDGATCPDGSCAATAELCGLEEAEATAIREGGRTIEAGTAPERTRVPTDMDGDGVPDFRDIDSDGDGLGDDTERAQNHNSSRSNRTEGIANDDLDSDGDGIPDFRAGDSDGDEIDDNEDIIAPAQDYNSTRSNRRKNVFSDSDSDIRPEVSMRAGGFIKIGSIEGEAIGRASSGEVVCWGRAEDEDGQVYSWGRGICVASEVTEHADEQARTRLTALQVRGNDVRTWNNEERSAWREYINSRTTPSSEERILSQMIEDSLINERIQEIISDDESIEMRYRTQMRLLGFIPIEREVIAQIDTSGEVEINYPWYRFLSTTPDNDRITSLLRDTMDILVLVPGRAG